MTSEWDRWINFVLTANVKSIVKVQAYRTTLAIQRHFEREWLPLTDVLEDGGLHLCWNSRDAYLEVEIWARGKMEWFFRDTSKDITAGSDTPVSALPGEFYVRASGMKRHVHEETNHRP